MDLFEALIYVESKYLELSTVYYISPVILVIVLLSPLWNVRALSSMHVTIPTLPLAQTSLENSDFVC